MDNAEETVEKVEHYMDEFKSKGEDEWIDKIYILKKMFKNLYGPINIIFFRIISYFDRNLKGRLLGKGLFFILQ